MRYRNHTAAAAIARTTTAQARAASMPRRVRTLGDVILLPDEEVTEGPGGDADGACTHQYDLEDVIHNVGHHGLRL